MIQSASQSFAKAAYQHAKRVGEVELWLTLLQTLTTALEHHKFETLMHSPIQVEAKLAIINKLVKLTAQQEAWFKLVFEAKRQSQLPEMLAYYQLLLQADQKMQRMSITSRVALSAEQQQHIKNKIKAKFSSGCDIDFLVNNRLLGGLIFAINGKVIDLSFNRMIETLMIN